MQQRTGRRTRLAAAISVGLIVIVLILDAIGAAIVTSIRVPLTLTIEAEDGSRQEIPVSAEVRKRLT